MVNNVVCPPLKCKKVPTVIISISYNILNHLFFVLLNVLPDCDEVVIKKLLSVNCYKKYIILYN